MYHISSPQHPEYRQHSHVHRIVHIKCPSAESSCSFPSSAPTLSIVQADRQQCSQRTELKRKCFDAFIAWIKIREQQNRCDDQKEQSPASAAIPKETEQHCPRRDQRFPIAEGCECTAGNDEQKSQKLPRLFPCIGSNAACHFHYDECRLH